MKKIILSIAALAIAVPSFAQQWATSGNNIYTTNMGNVGIGTTNPQNTLHVNGGITSTGGGPISTATPSLNMFYDVANDKGVIYSFQPTVAWKPLTLTAFNFSFISYGTNQGLFQDQNGNVGIGTTQPDQKLTVNGTIHSTEVKVTPTVPVPDYVFESSYKLPELTKLKNYLDANHHLPEIPSATEIEKNGLNVGDMNLKLLKKVEELTLYLIEKDKENKALQTRVEIIESQLKHRSKKSL